MIVDGLNSNRRVYAIITARGGSKGLPGKNIRSLVGKPLIVWTIESAKESQYIDCLVVSTDSQAIAEVANRAGASVPFLRPAELASDTASSIDVIMHAIDIIPANEEDIVLLLEPTSPLREASDIDAALRYLLASGASAVVSVCQAGCAHPDFMFQESETGRLLPYLGRSPNGLRRQDVRPAFFPDGSVYASYVNTLKEKRSFYHEDTVAYELPKWKSPEIDDLDDFIMVEALMGLRGNNP